MKKAFDFQFGLVLVSALLLCTFGTLTTQAQITRGIISGTVRDENGAVVPGAQITITSTGSSLTKREATTDDEGFYRIGALDPGSYNVLVEKDGFEKLENRDVVVKSAGEVTFDAALKTGSLTATVDVTSQSEGITLDKTSPTLGLTATSRQAVDLPPGPARDVNNWHCWPRTLSPHPVQPVFR